MLNVIYEDNHIIVVIKPHNMPSQQDESNDPDLLNLVKAYIKEKYDKKGNVYVGLVHRLDRPTGGIMVLARTSKAAERLSEQIREHKVKKVYYAVCAGKPKTKQAVLINYLKKDEKNNIVRLATQSEVGAKKAELSFKVLQTVGDLSLLEVEILTGRSHQIRVQLSSIGFPLYGDKKYNKNPTGKNLALWAGKLEFVHPVSKEKMVFLASPDTGAQPWKQFKMDQYFVRS